MLVRVRKAGFTVNGVEIERMEADGMVVSTNQSGERDHTMWTLEVRVVLDEEEYRAIAHDGVADAVARALTQ
jgi:hypothetical protein